MKQRKRNQTAIKSSTSIFPSLFSSNRRKASRTSWIKAVWSSGFAAAFKKVCRSIGSGNVLRYSSTSFFVGVFPAARIARQEITHAEGKEKINKTGGKFCFWEHAGLFVTEKGKHFCTAFNLIWSELFFRHNSFYKNKLWVLPDPQWKVAMTCFCSTLVDLFRPSQPLSPATILTNSIISQLNQDGFHLDSLETPTPDLTNMSFSHDFLSPNIIRIKAILVVDRLTIYVTLFDTKTKMEELVSQFTLLFVPVHNSFYLVIIAYLRLVTKQLHHWSLRLQKKSLESFSKSSLFLHTRILWQSEI